MSLNLSLDLKDATLADLEAFLAAARAADSDPHAALSVDGTVMRVDVDKPRVRPVEPQKGAQQRSRVDRPVAEHTIRSIIDALSERLDPPYPPRGGSFGSFGPDTD